MDAKQYAELTGAVMRDFGTTYERWLNACINDPPEGVPFANPRSTALTLTVFTILSTWQYNWAKIAGVPKEKLEAKRKSDVHLLAALTHAVNNTPRM